MLLLRAAHSGGIFSLHTSHLLALTSPALRSQIYLSRWHSTVQLKKRIFDDKIPHSMVQLRNSETGRLEPPCQLVDLLATTNLSAHRVELIAESPQPIVRIITRDFAKQLHKSDKSRVKELKKKQGGRKQLQMTWGVAGGDLARKVSKARSYLDESHDVDIVLSKKRGVPAPPPAVMAERMDDIVRSLADSSEEISRSIGSQLATIHLRSRTSHKPTIPPDDAAVADASVSGL